MSDKSIKLTWSGLFAADHYLVSLTILIILVAGLSAFINLPRIEDPRITTRNALITTTLAGASAERIEAEITKPIEDRIREISEVKRLESTSRANISVITLELQDRISKETNEAVFSKIRNKLTEAETELPAEASKPLFDDKRGAVAYTLITAVQWNSNTQVELGIMNRVAEELADRLRNVPGTEFVRNFGAPEEEITVTLDMGRVNQLGLTAQQIASLLNAADSKVVAGVLRDQKHDIQIEVVGEFETTRRILDIPLLSANDNTVVTLEDIATINREWRTPETEIALLNGKRAIFISARMDSGLQISEWSREAKQRVATYAASLDPRLNLEITYDESHYTLARLSTLGSNLLLGALVVMAVIMLFMGWRSALVVGSALPLSMGLSLFSMSVFGVELHQMSIFGLIVAIGLLIDNAIVMTEEIRKNMRRGYDALAAINQSVRHLFVPLFASTFTTVLGFMPVFLLQGNVGDFVGPIAISVVLALISSFFIALLVIPALTIRFAKPTERTNNIWWRDGVKPMWLIDCYRRFLTWAVTAPLFNMVLITVLAFSGFYLASKLGNEFFPTADRDQFQVEVWMPGDSSISGTHDVVKSINQSIETRVGVKRITWLVGGSTPPVYYNAIQTQDQNPSYAQAVVYADSTTRAVKLIAELQTELNKQFPGAQIVVSPFGQGPPIEAPIGYRISGPDMDKLKYWGDELRRLMNTVPHITHTQGTITGGNPKLWFNADEIRVKQAGLTLREIAAQLQFGLEGTTGGSVLEDLEDLPVRLRADQATRASLNDIASLSVVSSKVAGRAEWIPLSALGEFEIKPEPSSITRRNGERVNYIYGYVEPGYLPIDIMRAIEKRLEQENFVLPYPYRLEIAGDSEEQKRAVSQLITYLPVLLTLMLTTIILSFKNLGLSMVIGMVALQSVGFGMFSLWLGGYNIGFNPLIGTAGLIGVAINGTIVVLAALKANVQASAGELEHIVTVTIESGRHIISTTVTTVGGFIPLLMFTEGQFWPPLAIVIAGGVGFSIILSMLFTPCAFAFLSQFNKQAKQHSIYPVVEGGAA